MKKLLLCLLTLASLTPTLRAQNTPDIAGTWQGHPSRSQSPHRPPRSPKPPPAIPQLFIQHRPRAAAPIPGHLHHPRRLIPSSSRSLPSTAATPAPFAAPTASPSPAHGRKTCRPAPAQPPAPHQRKLHGRYPTHPKATPKPPSTPKSSTPTSAATSSALPSSTLLATAITSTSSHPAQATLSNSSPRAPKNSSPRSRRSRSASTPTSRATRPSSSPPPDRPRHHRQTHRRAYRRNPQNPASRKSTALVAAAYAEQPVGSVTVGGSLRQRPLPLDQKLRQRRRHLEKKLPADKDTIYRIGSITKMFHRRHAHAARRYADKVHLSKTPRKNTSPRSKPSRGR